MELVDQVDCGFHVELAVSIIGMQIDVDIETSTRAQRIAIQVHAGRSPHRKSKSLIAKTAVRIQRRDHLLFPVGIGQYMNVAKYSVAYHALANS